MIAKDVVFMTAYGKNYSLDIYSDASTAADQPLVVMVHGGGFNSGSRTNRKWPGQAAMFVERGFRVANIDYPLCPDYFDTRTIEEGELMAWDGTQPIEPPGSSMCNNMASPRNRLPDEIKGTMVEIATRSVRLAIHYMHTGGRAAQYQIDTTRTVCYGESAGAVTCAEAWLFNTSVISFPDQTNALEPDPVLNQYTVDVAAGISGGFTAGLVRPVTQETVDAMSPNSAVWDLHGDDDDILPLNASRNLMAIAERWGFPHELIINAGATHSTNELNETTTAAMFTFINRHLNVASTPSLPPSRPCQSAEEQQGSLCQLMCNCNCTVDGLASCEAVCRLPNGVQSLPWCQGGSSTDTNVTVETDVVFMTAFGQDFALDIYSDTTVDADQPLAVIVHGGSFVGGDKADRASEALLFAARGFRAVSINYPLCRHMFDHTTNAMHPWDASSPTDGNNSRCMGVASGTDDLPEDVRGSLAGPASRAARLAIKYMHTGGRAATHRVDTSKSVCHGMSAGAITCYATLLWNTTRIQYPNMTNALVPDPELDQYGFNVAAACAGGLPSGEHVTQDTVNAMAPGAAVWDLHGDADLTVPLLFSNVLMAIAEQWGIPHDQVVIPGGGHGIMPYLTGSVLEEMFTFIFDNLENVGSPPVSGPSTTPLSTATVPSSSNPLANLSTDAPISPGRDSPSSSVDDDGDSSTIVILTVVIALVAMIMVVIGVVAWRRRAAGSDFGAATNRMASAHPAHENPTYGLVPDAAEI